MIVGGAAFFGGIKFQESKANAQGGGHNQFGVNGQRFGGQRGSGNSQPVRGEISSTDDSSITVKMQDGSSKIVLLSDTTSITEATSSSKQSLTTGKQVMVFGSNNSDGSVTAQNIQLNPRGGFGDHQGNQEGGTNR